MDPQPERQAADRLLEGRRVLVTGSSGFVGSRLCAALQAAGAEVAGLTSEGGDEAGLRVFTADIAASSPLRAALAAFRPETVVHLAGLSHVGESWKRPGDYLRVNFGGTRNLVRLAGDAQVIFASSAEVYGAVPAAEQPIGEERPPEPRSPYAMTKACAEQVALDYGAVVVRSFNTLGPGQASIFALPSFAAQLRAIARGEAEPVLRVGDLSPRRDFLHLDDAVAGYLALVARGRRATVYNLASGEAHSIGEVLARLMAIAGVEAEVRRDESRVRPIDVPLLQGDGQRLRDLGWAPRRSLDEALADLWQATAAEPAKELR